MSARVSRCNSSKGAGPSSQKRMLLGVDLNVPPFDPFHFGEVDGSRPTPTTPVMRGEQRSRPPPVTIDVDIIDDDDDVVLSSPRAFAEARNNSRRRRSRRDVIDVELVESSNRESANARNKRQRIPANQPIIDCESHVESHEHAENLIEFGRFLLSQSRKSVIPSPPPPPPPPPPQEASYSCPICMCPLVEEMSTKCGHIFCKECIKKALSFQSKCPTCRKKVTMRGTIRVYLPKTS